MLKNKSTTYINVFTSILTLLITIIIDFFLSPFIVQKLGAEANGYAQMATNFINFASLLTLALNSMGARSITIYYHKGDFEKANKLYTALIIGNIFIIALLIVPASISILLMENIIEIKGVDLLDVKFLFALSFFSFFAAQFISIFNTGAFLKNKIYLNNIISCSGVAIRGCLYILLFTFFKARISYISLTSALINSVSIIFAFFIKKKIVPDLKFSLRYFSFSSIKELLGLGVWNAINQGGNLLMTGFDLLLTNILISSSAMGVLAVAKIVPNIIILLSTTVNNTLVAHQTITYSVRSKEEYLKTIKRTIIFSTFLILIPTVIFLCSSTGFYSVWQPTLNKNELATLSFLSCFALIPLAGTQSIFNVMTTTGKVRFNALTFLGSGVINIVLVILFVTLTDASIYAVAGISSALSLLRNLFFVIPYVSRLLKVKSYYIYKYVLLSCFVAFIIAAISIGVGKIIFINSWKSLIFNISLTILIIGFLSGTFLIVFRRKES